MQEKGFTLPRAISGIILMVFGFSLIPQIFNNVPFDNRLISLPIIFSIAVIIGFGAWLLSQYPLKMFLEPFIIITFWSFLLVLPILLLPLSIDVQGLAISLSTLLPVVLYGNYSKGRSKRKKS